MLSLRRLITKLTAPWSARPICQKTAAEYLTSRFGHYCPPKQVVHTPYIRDELLPNNICGTKPSWKFTSLRSREIPEASVLQLSDGRCWGTNGTILSADRILLSDVSREFGQKEHRMFRRRFIPQPSHYDSNIAVAATAGASLYYHWMFDVLPRLWLLEKAGVTPHLDKIILPRLTHAYEAETLQKMGIDPDTYLISEHSNFHVSAAHLFVPSLPSPLGTVSPWVCDFLRDLYGVDKNRVHARTATRKLYVTRRLAQRRRVINEDELLHHLEELGFEVVECELLTVAQQAKLFAEARIVVAPHGGGLSNLVFCPPGVTVVELFPSSFVVPCFWILANAVNLNYWYMIDQQEKGQFAPFWTSKSEDFHVSLKTLLPFIENQLTCKNAC